jgi:predicted transcriptional regulator
MKLRASLHIFCFSALTTLASSAYAVLTEGQVAPLLELTGKAGGTVDGKAWSSKDFETAGKVHLLVYTNVGEKDTNNATTEAIQAAKPDRNKFASVAIINMAGSWLTPNFMIDKSLKEKQEKYPHTTYVRDMDRAVVKQWKLADGENCVALFDKNGKVLFSKDGKLTAAEKDKVVKTIMDLTK